MDQKNWDCSVPMRNARVDCDYSPMSSGMLDCAEKTLALTKVFLLTSRQPTKWQQSHGFFKKQQAAAARAF